MEMTHPHTIHKNHTTNLDTLAGNRDNLTVGAENTHKEAVSDSRHVVGFLLSGFYAGSSREYNTRAAGNTCWPISLRFFQLPGAFLVPGKYVERISLLVSALKKRSKEKGTQVFSALIFGVPAVYPLTAVSARPASVEGVAA